MAWSDAAREAALEARRAHLDQKSRFSKTSDTFKKAHGGSLQGNVVRANMAHALRAIRSGVTGGGFSDSVWRNKLHRDAAASTAYRNLRRQAAKTKGRKDPTFSNRGGVPTHWINPTFLKRGK